MNAVEGRTIKNSISNLQLLTNSFLEAFSESSGQIRENTISIKLPAIKDLDDLAKASSVFNTILSQTIVNTEIKGVIEIDNVENGSIWLEIFVGSSAAITLIAGLAWSAAVVYKKIQEGRIFEEYVKV